MTTEGFNIVTRTVATGEVEVQWDSDDPAYQTAYVTETDAEGQEYQAEEQQYIGEPDLLAVIKDLRARLAAIEANEVVDDATDSVAHTCGKPFYSCFCSEGLDYVKPT